MVRLGLLVALHKRLGYWPHPCMVLSFFLLLYQVSLSIVLLVVYYLYITVSHAFILSVSVCSGLHNLLYITDLLTSFIVMLVMEDWF